MFEQVAGALMVATIGGLAFLAYKHPDTYRRVALAAIALFIVMSVVFRAYVMGIARAMQIFTAPSPPLAQRAVDTLIAHREAMDKLTYCGIVIVVIAVGLTYLPKLLGNGEKPKVKKK